jgi:ketosteroid isomerase-like protein
MENVKQHIIDLEKEYWQAIVDKDFESALRLSADPCVVTGAQGAATIDHGTFRQMMGDSRWELHDFNLADVQVSVPTDGIALIAYTVTEQMTVDGKPLTLKAADASTWLRDGDSWKCVLHTESILGDPFGRDKAAAAPAKKPAAKKAAARKPIARKRGRSRARTTR